MRVRSLLLTTGSNVQSLLSHLDESGSVLHYPGIKASLRSAKPVAIPLAAESRPYIERLSADLRRLQAGRNSEDRVMSRTEGGSELLSVTTLNKRLNRIMSRASGTTGKLLRTHSFRIGLTTSLVATSGIEVAQTILGYSDFRTTATYNRHSYKQKELTKALGSAYKRGAPRARRQSKRSSSGSKTIKKAIPR